LRPARYPNTIGAFVESPVAVGSNLPKAEPRIDRGRAAGFFDRFTETQINLGVLLLGLLLYVPFAGTYGLFDPWETHYSEVARQMTVRGDYISLWWPGAPLDADHFWSKPVLSFWLMSLFLRVFGLAAAAPGAIALGARAEWAVRLPFCLMGVLGLWAVYLCLSRFVSRRAGILGVVVLGTSPLYSLVARQAMTDMAFVGPMTMALSLGALAIFDDTDETLPRKHLAWSARRPGGATALPLGWLRRFSWPHHPVFYVAVACFVVAVVPQLIFNSIYSPWPVHLGKRAFYIPAPVVMLPYWVGFVAFIGLSARVRYKAPLYLFIAATLCGVATLAKGLAGLGLPVIIFVAYLLFTWNWKRLARAQLGYAILVALLAVAVVAVPWHHAMLIRHGFPFWDELYGDNHWRRLVLGRHGDRGSFEYFLRELGYAVLPWIGIAPAALATVTMQPARAFRRQGMLWFGAIWFIAGYALVSLSVTKFHHYILPAVPGLAIVIACFLDGLLARRSGRVAALTAILGAGVWAVVTFDLVSAKNSAQHFIWLFSYDYVNTPKGRPWPEGLDYRPMLIGFSAAFAVATAFVIPTRLRRFGVVAACGVAIAFGYVLLDRYMPQTAHYWSQKPLLATYYKLRRSPDEKLLVWQMYWRGENFYTQNEIYEGPPAERTVFLGDRNVENLKDWIARHRKRRVFILVERSRYAQVPAMLPEESRATLHIVDESNMKFVLAELKI
jgi:4-amino-4-deoxy-L-arabinose transferase-like glycosyltransferase